jgi:microcin C transport system ATP-binding protein
MAAAQQQLLDIQRLTVRFGPSTVVDDVSFAVAPGEKFALVGESGSGKSITALSVLRLVDAATSSGAIRFDGEDLMLKSERQMQGLRGGRIGMIFQEPMTALNPLYTVGNQIGEVLVLHEGMRPNATRARAIELLGHTGIPEPERRVDAYPHEAPHLRRAHDRPRRHHPSPDSRPSRGAAARDGHGAPLHHP